MTSSLELNVVPTLVVLKEVNGFSGFGRVSLHDVIVEQGGATEETEAAWTT